MSDSARSTRRLAIAVSGGVDSIALLGLLHESLGSITARDNILAFTVDHKLRPESSAEAWAVQKRVQALGIHHEVLLLPVPLPRTGIEKHARIARYTALTEACLRHGIGDLYLGHHADDQAETILLRLSHGSRWRGQMGMRVRAENPLARTVRLAHRLTLHRPLLSIPKARLVATCRALGLSWHEDVTNQDVGLTARNAARVLLQNHATLPASLQPRALLDHAKVLSDAFEMQRERKAELFGASNAGYCRVTNAISWDTRPLSRARKSDDFKMDFLKDFARVVAPVEWVDRRAMATVLDHLQRHVLDRRRAQCTAAGLVWKFERDRCHTYRQPFIRHEVHFHEICPAEAESGCWTLFDRRWWLYIKTERKSLVIIRNLDPTDIGKLRAVAKSTDSENALQTFFSVAKGSLRFTLPVIVNKDSDSILALPSAGLTFDRSMQTACEASAEHVWRTLKHVPEGRNAIVSREYGQDESLIPS